MDIRTLSNRLHEAGVENAVIRMEDAYGDECIIVTQELRPEHVLRGDDIFLRHIDPNCGPGEFIHASFLFGEDEYEIEVYGCYVRLSCQAFRPAPGPCSSAQAATLGVSQSWLEATYDPTFSVLEAV
jgi:hypothetical protein